MANEVEETGKGEAERRRKKRRKVAFWMSLVVVILDILAIALGTMTGLIPLALSIACVGIFTFFGVLILSSYLSRDDTLTQKEMRKAIAASFTLVYLILLALVVFGEVSSEQTDLAQTVTGHFTWVVGIIIVFYFGSRSVEELIKLWRKN